MRLVRSAVVSTGLLLHPAAATFGYGGWGGDSSYSTPSNTDNKCSTDQAKGYDWAGLSSGSFDSYGSNKFSNWSCTNSFGKRDLLTKRTFQAKCISSNLDDEPSIGCNGDDSMSIDKYEVSSSEDTDIECHYEMPDQTVCKEYHSCKSGGTVIQNTQCGGAKSVTFKPAEGYQGKGCSIGVHSIGFDCGTASSTVPASSSTESLPAYASSSPPTYVTTSSESSTEIVPTSSAVEITTDATPYTSPSSTESATSATAPSYDTTTDITTSSLLPTVSVPIYYNTTSPASSTASETAPIGTTTESASSYGASTCLEGYGSSCSTTIASSIESGSSSATSRETSPVETSASGSSSASSTASETVPLETSTQSAPSYESSTCVEGYGASCSTIASSSEILTSSATSRETSPVDTSASSSSIISTSSTISSTESSPASVTMTMSTASSPTGSIPAYASSSTGTGGAIPSSNTSLTYSVPAYPHSSSNAVGTTSVGSYGSYTTSTIYSSTCETITSSGTTATLTKTYAVSTTIAPVTSPEKESSAVETSSASATSYSGPEPSSPALLPRCLNTWMYLTDCSSNSDSNCYCKHEDFINKVYGCLSSWSQSADNATNGVSYLMGLCAPYIGDNPAIITGCPSTITPAAYTPPATSALPTTSTLSQTSTITLQSTVTSAITISPGPAPSSSTEVSPENTSSPAPTVPASVPCTTITYSSQVTVPATYLTGSSQGSVIPSSSITSAIVTTITVPQVIMTTHTVTESGSTMTAPGLGYGTPAAPTSTLVSPVTTSKAAPVYGSSGLTKSVSASAVPTGIVPYEGPGVKSSATSLLSVAFCVIASMMLL